MKKVILVALLLTIFNEINFAQTKDYEVGSSLIDRFRGSTGFFDFSDPGSVNMKVNVWGYVRYPGKYTVPVYTTVIDLISFAGGPTDDAELEEVRLIKKDEQGKETMYVFNLNDMVRETELYKSYRSLPDLGGGDILIVPGEPRLFFRDWLSITTSVISTLVTITLLVLNITGN